MTTVSTKSRASVVRRPLLAAAMAASAIAPAPALAAFDVYLKLDGLNGEVASGPYANWSVVKAYTVGIQHPIERPVCALFLITKQMDKMTPKLMAFTFSGRRFNTGEVHVVLAGGALLVKYELAHVTLTSAQESGQPGDAVPLETVALKYGRLTTTVYSQGGGTTASVSTDAAVVTPVGPQVKSTVDCEAGIAF